MRQNKLKLKKENNPDGKKPSLVQMPTGWEQEIVWAGQTLATCSTLTKASSWSVPAAILCHLLNLGEKLGARSRVMHQFKYLKQSLA